MDEVVRAHVRRIRPAVARREVLEQLDAGAPRRAQISNSPFMGWLYGILSVQGVSNLIGCTEIATSILIALRRFSPRASAIGSALAVGIFATTLSFLFTTPGGLSTQGPAFGFLVKDVVLLGAAVYTLGEALRAARVRTAAATPSLSGLAKPAAHPAS